MAETVIAFLLDLVSAIRVAGLSVPGRGMLEPAQRTALMRHFAGLRMQRCVAATSMVGERLRCGEVRGMWVHYRDSWRPPRLRREAEGLLIAGVARAKVYCAGGNR